MCFTITNQMEDDNGKGETPCDLTEPRIVPYRKTWKPHQNTVYWCYFELAQGRGWQFYQTRSHAIVLYDTLLAACIEKAVCMKTHEELYQKKRLTPRVPRVVLEANSQSGQQDARSSWDPPSESKSYGETWNNAVDCRFLSIPLSTVEQQDTNRQNKVKKLIEKFENHQHKESFLQDLSQTKKINRFSKESQDLIAGMNITEIFELCENSSKQQCPDCNTYWETGKSTAVVEEIYNLRRDRKEFEKNNYDVTSIPGYVIKKNSSRGANMDLLNDNECTTRRNRC